MKQIVLLAVALLCVGGLWLGCERPAEVAIQQSYSPPIGQLPAAAPVLQPGEKVAFVELGSVGCKPCEAMKPVMQAVRERYPEQVEVVFHDVKKNHALAGQYKVRLIPTQVFLLADGTEFFRHEGFFALDDVVAVLERMGAR